MNFDKSRVYTALNADEVKVGSKVLVAYNIGVLKNCVLGGFAPEIIAKIKSEFDTARFQISTGSSFPFCYLVEAPEEPKLKWTDLKLFDHLRREDGTEEGIVICIDRNDTASHVYCGHWLDDTDLEEWEKVE